MNARKSPARGLCCLLTWNTAVLGLGEAAWGFPHVSGLDTIVVVAITASSDISKSFVQRAALRGATSEQAPGSAMRLLGGLLVPPPVQEEPSGALFSGQGALQGASSPSWCIPHQTSAGSSLSPSQASCALAPPGAPPCAARSLELPAGRGSRQHPCQPSWAQQGSHLLLLMVPTSKPSPIPPTSTTPHLWQLQDAVKHFST